MPSIQPPKIRLQSPRFSPSLFQFLGELKVNNNRDWFQANKARFETDVKGPMLAFILALADPLEGINPHFLADPRPVGGSLFRINRDTRFAADKAPYKHNVGAQFRHRSCPKEVHSPAFYLHLEPGESFAGAGLWRPDPVALHQVRERIVEHPKAWRALRAKGIEVEGEARKRVPPGFDPAHPLAEDLKLTDFYTSTALTDRELCAPDFLERYLDICRRNAPLMAFLTRALDLPW